jgi:hypothetical protein
MDAAEKRLTWQVTSTRASVDCPGFVKLMRLRFASGKRVLPLSLHPLGSPFRAGNFGPLLESIAHHFTVLRGG